MLAARDRMWSFAGSNHRRIGGQALYRTGAKIECSMNGAANLVDQNMQDMLSFVMEITKKSFYSPPSTLISVRRL